MNICANLRALMQLKNAMPNNVMEVLTMLLENNELPSPFFDCDEYIPRSVMNLSKLLIDFLNKEDYTNALKTAEQLQNTCNYYTVLYDGIVETLSLMNKLHLTTVKCFPNNFEDVKYVCEILSDNGTYILELPCTQKTIHADYSFHVNNKRYVITSTLYDDNVNYIGYQNFFTYISEKIINLYTNDVDRFIEHMQKHCTQLIFTNDVISLIIGYTGERYTIRVNPTSKESYVSLLAMTYESVFLSGDK